MPLVQGKIAAGSGRVVEEQIKDYVWVRNRRLSRRRNLVAVQIGSNGRSMSPSMPPGRLRRSASGQRVCIEAFDGGQGHKDRFAAVR